MKTKLERNIISRFRAAGGSGADELREFLRDIVETGGYSEMPSEWEAEKYFLRYSREISAQFVDDFGETLPQEVFPLWNEQDPFALSTQNRAILGRYGIQAAAFRLLEAFE